MTALPTVAVIGGTGAEGGGLAVRLAHAGYPVWLGSRSAEKAAAAAVELGALAGRPIAAAGNAGAARAASIVLLCVPYPAQVATVAEIAAELPGKLLIDVTVPLAPPKVSRVQLPPGGSCVLALRDSLPEGVRLVSAFQNVSAHRLRQLDAEIACDVLVCADEAAARREAIDLVCAIGLRGIDAGPLQNSAAAEALTSVLIWINRAYKVPDAGLRITGLPEA
ncbi:MAG: NADPH-dependent F420 reductase [Sneathiellaceae bacterium]